MDRPAVFKRRPLHVEAIRWTGDNREAVAAFIGPDCEFERDGDIVYATTASLEGIAEAAPGDWLIREPCGDLASCEPAVFTLTYEPAAKRNGGAPAEGDTAVGPGT